MTGRKGAFDGRSDLSLLGAVGCLVTMVVLIGWLVSRHALNVLDSSVLLSARDALGTATEVRRIMLDLTALGDTATLIALLSVVAIGAASAGQRTLAAFLAVEGGIGLSIAHLVKPVVDRARPMIETHLTEASGLSFPSGHATSGTLIYVSIALLIASPRRSPALGRFAICVAIVLSAGIGISRIYLGVHWPSDVIAGWMLGTAWAIAASVIARRAGLLPAR